MTGRFQSIHAILLTAFLCFQPALSRAAKPNVLLILVDDLKPALGCYGDAAAKSPNIDALAARGLRFDLAYCNQAVCAPSRFTLMLGSRSTSTGLYGLGSQLREILPQAVTLPQHFAKHGYRTESLGKVFHIGHGNTGDPESFSVPHFKDKVIEYLDPRSTDGGKLTREEALFTNQKLGQIRSLPRGAAFEAPAAEDFGYADGRVAREAIQRLQAAQKRRETEGTPFFIAVGFVRPHLPFSVPKKYWDLHDPDKLTMPAFETLPEGAPTVAGKRGGEIAAYTPVPPGGGKISDALKRQLIHGYYASVSYVDATIGKVVGELDRLDLAKNTIVVLWGDHGFHLGDLGIWTKHTNYEQANRIPLLVRAPGVTQPNTSTKQLAESVDLFPTLAELAGLPKPTGPQPIDGVSLAPVLANPDARVRDHAFHAYPKRKMGRAIRTERYRLVEWKNHGEPASQAEYELYDYESDPNETKNLAASLPEVLGKMQAILARHPEAVPRGKKPAPRQANAPWHSIVGRFCIDCHDADTQKGGVDLDSILDAPIAANALTWERAVRQMQARHMPPIGKPRPNETSYDFAAGALISRLDAAAEKNPAPGRTDTLRRLTRYEYQNAVRDLLALEIDATELLPADSSSHGFDNVTVADLSPALLERYLSAAQKISRLAVGGVAGEPESRIIRVRPDVTQQEHVEGLPLGTRGGTLIRHNFPRTGEYEVRVRLMRDRNEHVEGLRGTHELEVLLDGRRMANFEVKPPKNRADHTQVDAHLQARIPVSAGPRDLGVTFAKWPTALAETLRQPYQAQFNFHRHPRRSPAVFQVSITGPFSAEKPGQTPSRRRIFVVRPTSADDEERCATRILSTLMRRAYRRPVDDADLRRTLEFFRSGRAEGGFEAGIESALSAVLVSREFLFRVEREPEGLTPGSAYPLSDLDLASRLSFFLWSSIPDEELLDLAERGKLRDPAVLERQARRMLADPRSQSLVANFAGQWLHLRNLDAITPDGRLFPDFDDNLRQAMRRETELLFARVLKADRSVLSLLSTRETYLNERLAKHYGIPHVYGTRFRRVGLEPSSRRGGILRHGSILTVTSYATRTSPVIRGKWILENVAGVSPPPPPPNVPTLDDSRVSASLPIRERLAAHREKAACASCHNLIDPVGFALENYDAVGAGGSGTQTAAPSTLPVAGRMGARFSAWRGWNRRFWSGRKRSCAP